VDLAKHGGGLPLTRRQSAIWLCRGFWPSTQWTILGLFWCRRAGAVELADLGSDAFPLTAELALVSLALKELTHCDKLNIAAIGNVVPQLTFMSSRAAEPIPSGRSRCSA